MKIRFGFVAHALELWDASPSKTLTFTRYKQLGKDERFERLKAITYQNIIHTKRILYYLLAHEIKLYRFSSALVPLATHPEVLWDYVTPFRTEWKELGELVKKGNIRPSFHPSQYTLLTSQREEVTENAVRDLVYHEKLLTAMEITEHAAINIHIGGSYGNKEEALLRFHHNFQKLPQCLKQLITLENDDKTYNIEETLLACEQENIPMVLDYDHYKANQDYLELLSFVDRIFRTWKSRNLRPIVHLSSPKTTVEYRAHHDFVSIDFVLPFIKMMKEINRDFDVIVEAKQKNLAMFKLIEEITKIRGVKRTGSAEIEW